VGGRDERRGAADSIVLLPTPVSAAAALDRGPSRPGCLLSGGATRDAANRRRILLLEDPPAGIVERAAAAVGTP